MNIGELCSRELVTASADAPLADVARLLRDHHVGAVVITKSPLDRPVPVGIITDRDIVCAQLDRAADLFCLSAADVMTRDPLVLPAHTPLEAAISRLRERGVRRAPVVDESGGLVGLVSIDDLLAAVAESLIGLSRLVASQPRREEATRRSLQ